MMDYLSNILVDVLKNNKGHSVTPTAKHLFEVNEMARNFSKDDAQIFHTNRGQAPVSEQMDAARYTQWGGIPNNKGDRTRRKRREETLPHSQVPIKHARPYTNPRFRWIRDGKIVGRR